MTHVVLGTFAGLNNDTGNLQSEDVGSARRRRIESAALEDVGPVHAGGGDFDQHFARAGPRHLAINDRKLLRPIRLRAHDCFHRSWNAVAHARRLLTERAHGSNGSHMDLDELFPSKPGDPLVELGKQDLDPMSIEELQARIESLKVEIARVEAHMTRVQAHRSAAEDLFKK
jgi:uncharacterized small protein (DUF1192 family)